MKAAIYCRVSTKAQSDDGTSLISQERACRKFATEQGYEVSVVFSHDYPADTLDRPIFNELREGIKQKRWDAIIAYDTDRISRNPIHTLLIAEECDKAGVALHFVLTPTESTPAGQLLLFVRGWASQLEREKIKERTMRGKAERARNGQIPHGTGIGAYGYDYDKAAGKRTINEDEAATVRQMFARCAEGASAYQIAVELNDRGITAKSGKPWNPWTITHTLRNDSYRGVFYANQYQRLNLGGRKYRMLKRPRPEWVEIAGACPAIVDEIVFQAAQWRLDHPRINPVTRKSRTFLLSGLIHCGCGSPMHGHSLAKGRWVYYRCRNSVNDKIRPRTCPAPEVSALELENAVWQRVKRALQNPELIFAEMRSRDTSADTESTLEDLKRQLKRLDDQQSRLVRLYRFGEIDDASIQKEGGALKRQREALEQDVKESELRVHQRQNQSQAEAGAIAYCQTISRGLDRFELADQRLALEALSVRVVLPIGQAPEIRGLIPSLVNSSGSELVTTGQTWA